MQLVHEVDGALHAAKRAGGCRCVRAEAKPTRLRRTG
jgi:hypothetical protein